MDIKARDLAQKRADRLGCVTRDERFRLQRNFHLAKVEALTESIEENKV